MSAHQVRQRIWFRDDRGSAVVEFSAVGLVLLLPVIYLVTTLGRIEAAAFATHSAARNAALAIARAESEEQGRIHARAIVALAFRDHRIDADPDRALQVECPDGCQNPGGTVQVTVLTAVSLPGAPSWLRDSEVASIPVSGRVSVAVDEYRQAAT